MMVWNIFLIMTCSLKFHYIYVYYAVCIIVIVNIQDYTNRFIKVAGCYRNISSDALSILTGISPISTTFKYEFTKSNIIRLVNEDILQQYFLQIVIQWKTLGWQFHPAFETSHLEVKLTINSYFTLKILWSLPMAHPLLPE